METIIALLMFVGEPQQLKEMTYIPTLSECLKKKYSSFIPILTIKLSGCFGDGSFLPSIIW